MSNDSSETDTPRYMDSDSDIPFRYLKARYPDSDSETGSTPVKRKRAISSDSSEADTPRYIKINPTSLPNLFLARILEFLLFPTSILSINKAIYQMLQPGFYTKITEFTVRYGLTWQEGRVIFGSADWYDLDPGQALKIRGLIAQQDTFNFEEYIEVMKLQTYELGIPIDEYLKHSEMFQDTVWSFSSEVSRRYGLTRRQAFHFLMLLNSQSRHLTTNEYLHRMSMRELGYQITIMRVKARSLDYSIDKYLAKAWLYHQSSNAYQTSQV